jgi:hypothetical protein
VEGAVEGLTSLGRLGGIEPESRVGGAGLFGERAGPARGDDLSGFLDGKAGGRCNMGELGRDAKE